MPCGDVGSVFLDARLADKNRYSEVSKKRRKWVQVGRYTSREKGRHYLTFFRTGSRGIPRELPRVPMGYHGDPRKVPRDTAGSPTETRRISRGISNVSSHGSPYIFQIEPIVAGWVLVRRGTVWPEYVVESSSRLMFMLYIWALPGLSRRHNRFWKGWDHARAICARRILEYPLLSGKWVGTHLCPHIISAAIAPQADRWMWYLIELSIDNVLARTHSWDAFTRAPVLVHAACLVSVAASEAPLYVVIRADS